MYISNSVVNDGYNHADSCEAYKLRTENLMRATINIAHHSQVEEASCRFSKGAIRWISNFVISANPSDSCEPYKRRTDDFMRATVNICQSYIVPDCRDSMEAILYITNFVRRDDPSDSCEAYKLRSDNFMRAIINICNSYISSSASDASCKYSMSNINNLSNIISIPSDPCETYKPKIDAHMRSIQSYANFPRDQ